jgi:hypothetical protein
MDSIIAVHGIETCSPKTWTAYEDDTVTNSCKVNWLEDEHMLPSVVRDARIWTFDYNSNYSHNAQRVRIPEIARVLLTLIKDRFDEFQGRQIIFIGSCFGGIVVSAVSHSAFLRSRPCSPKLLL